MKEFNLNIRKSLSNVHGRTATRISAPQICKLEIQVTEAKERREVTN
jgi:hypothetical protein